MEIITTGPAPSRDTPLEAREQRRNERRTRLVEAAMHLFATRGFNVTSVDDIVAAAHTSKSAFYEFWGSKEDCVRDQLVEQGGALINAVFIAAAEGVDHRDRLRRGIGRFVGLCMEFRELASVMLVEAVGVSPAVEAARHAVQDRFAHLIEAEVRANAPDDGFYELVDPAVFGRAVVGACYEATAHSLRNPGTDVGTLARGLASIFAPEH